MTPSPFFATSNFQATDWFLIGAVVVLLLVSAALALAETSLVRMSRTKAMALVDDKRRGAGSLLRLVQDPEEFLNPILLLVLVSQLVTATLVGILADRWFGPIGVIAATVFEVIVIFVFAEALPKNWAVQNPERSALLLAPMVSAVVRFPPIRIVSRGLIGLANMLLGPRRRQIGVSESELLAMADVAHEEDVIEGHERELIHSIIEFGDTVVREVMVPRPDMRTLDAELTVSDALGVAIEAGFSRLPVQAGNVDDIVGAAHAKDLIRAEREGHGSEPVSAFLRPAHFVPETKRVARLMREMQELKYHQAIVVDEYGGTAGVVTLEDLIEELVGEIVDEYDVEEPPVSPFDDGTFSISARLAVDELSELVDTELPSGEWDTAGGLLFNVLGRVPVEGESVDIDGLTLVAERVEGNRVGRIRIILPRSAVHASPSSSPSSSSSSSSSSAPPPVTPSSAADADGGER